MKRGFLSGNQLKLIAMVTMTLDHAGLMLLPGLEILRIIGRLSMPLYAFMIAEGCRHTHDRKRYLLRLLGLGIVCQVVYLVAMGSVYMCILITFSLSVAMIAAAEYAVRSRSAAAAALAIGTVAASFFICAILPGLLPGTDFAVDYGFFGALLPAAGYFGGLPGFVLCLAGLCLQHGAIQWWSFAAVPLIALYSGQRGKMKLGKFFYYYYPLHLAALYGISLIM